MTSTENRAVVPSLLLFFFFFHISTTGMIKNWNLVGFLEREYS